MMGMICIIQRSVWEIRRHLLLVLTLFLVVDELVLDELLVDRFFFLSSSSSSSFLVGVVDGAFFGVDLLLRDSVRDFITSRFCLVWLSRTLLVGVDFVLRSGSRRLDELDRVLAEDLVLLFELLVVRLGVSTLLVGCLVLLESSVCLRKAEEVLDCPRR
jgi:hypothetical protein